jgi:hypothetical protein
VVHGRGEALEHFGLDPLVSSDVCHTLSFLVLPIARTGGTARVNHPPRTTES